MKSTLNQFAGVCAILAGLFTAVAAVLYILLPDAQKLQVPGAQLLPSFAQNPTLLMLENLSLGLVGIFGLGVVPALGQILHGSENGALRWTSNLANVGYAVSAVGSFVIIARLPVVANAYVQGDASTQAALAAVWRATLDPLGVWGYAAVGAWLIVVGLTARATTNAPLPTNLAYLGIAAGAVHWLIPISFVLRVPVLILVTAGVGLIVITAWYIWLGLVLRRAG